jgi:hypothetical protein
MHSVAARLWIAGWKTMGVTLQTSKLWLRIGATLIGIGYGVVGVFSIMVSGDAPNEELAGRALWMGITFVIASVLSISVSWLVKDLSNIWCIPAKKTKYPRLGSDS